MVPSSYIPNEDVCKVLLKTKQCETSNSTIFSIRSTLNLLMILVNVLIPQAKSLKPHQFSPPCFTMRFIYMFYKSLPIILQKKEVSDAFEVKEHVMVVLGDYAVITFPGFYHHQFSIFFNSNGISLHSGPWSVLGQSSFENGGGGERQWSSWWLMYARCNSLFCSFVLQNLLNGF